MTETEKVREDRVRRMFARQGFKLSKSYRRDPRAWDYGVYIATWLLGAADTGRVAKFFRDLDEAEAWAVAEDRGDEMTAVALRPDSDWTQIGMVTVSAGWGHVLDKPEVGPDNVKVLKDRTGRILYVKAD
jgi:hypothetical protein